MMSSPLLCLKFSISGRRGAKNLNYLQKWIIYKYFFMFINIKFSVSAAHQFFHARFQTSGRHHYACARLLLPPSRAAPPTSRRHIPYFGCPFIPPPNLRRVK